VISSEGLPRVLLPWREYQMLVQHAGSTSCSGGGDLPRHLKQKLNLQRFMAERAYYIGGSNDGSGNDPLDQEDPDFGAGKKYTPAVQRELESWTFFEAFAHRLDVNQADATRLFRSFAGGEENERVTCGNLRKVFEKGDSFTLEEFAIRVWAAKPAGESIESCFQQISGSSLLEERAMMGSAGSELLGGSAQYHVGEVDSTSKANKDQNSSTFGFRPRPQQMTRVQEANARRGLLRT
ncbi:unnamed protein product, partial [Amoebophrya sp. A25]